MVASSSEQVTSAHNVTVGASFGAGRELRFKHLETGLEFGFPQGNGDVFAFTEPVNSAFQHCIPKKLPAALAGPRISVILWGRTESHGILRDPSIQRMPATESSAILQHGYEKRRCGNALARA